MFNFNLLPPQEKKTLEIEKKSLLIGGILKFIFLLLLSFFILLLSINFSIRQLVSDQKKYLEERKNDELVKKTLSLDAKITSTNSMIDEVYSIQKKFIYFFPIIEKIIDIIPSEGVYLTDLKIEQKTTDQSEAVSQSLTNSEPLSLATPPSPKEAKPDKEDKTEKPQPQSFWEIIITGHALKREQVLLIQENIKKTPEFLNITSDLQNTQNVIKPTDVDFSFTLRLKK